VCVCIRCCSTVDVYIGTSGPAVVELRESNGWVYVKFKARRQLWRNLVYYEIVEVVRRPAAGPF